MKKITFILVFLISISNLKAQEYTFRKNIDKDSLFEASVKRLPENMRKEYTTEYQNGNETSKEFLLLMISMPESSKKELIENFENKKDEIQNLKSEYSKLVPEKYVVEIEFEPESKILTIPEQITIKIYKRNNNNLELVSQNWNLKPNSKELHKVVKKLNWTNQTLNDIQKLLKEANCISVENGEITTIGFARSGMGLYSYKIFESPLSSNQKTEYNNGCEYIYYKDNIVLEYGGGAFGPQCFEQQ